MITREEFMRLALSEAQSAAAEDEVPVGCVIVRNGEVIARTHNLCRTLPDPTAHAEVLAIREAAAHLGSERLQGCELYVTLEPCPMCAGAMVMAGLKACFFGAFDPRQGCCGSIYAIPGDPAFYHRLPCCGGILEKETAQVMENFFSGKRKAKEGAVR